jgi:hypothetical protein
MICRKNPGNGSFSTSSESASSDSTSVSLGIEMLLSVKTVELLSDFRVELGEPLGGDESSNLMAEIEADSCST